MIRSLIKNLVLLSCVIWIAMSFVKLDRGLNEIFVPVAVNSIVADPVKEKLASLGAPEAKVDDLAQGIHLASASTGLNNNLLIALIYTESTFKINAVSSKGYKGLMQTPFATLKWADVDILVGAKILKEKLAMTDNNLSEALALYKGGKNSVARKQAKYTLEIYKRLQQV